MLGGCLAGCLSGACPAVSGSNSTCNFPANIVSAVCFASLKCPFRFQLPAAQFFWACGDCQIRTGLT